jgi:hypothetical protein
MDSDVEMGGRGVAESLKASDASGCERHERTPSRLMREQRGTAKKGLEVDKW